MFFIIGVTSGAHDLGLRRCGCLPCCSGGAMAAVTCTFQQFTLFFIPLFRFGKRYFVTCPNCGTVYELAKDEGRRIEKDSAAEINPERMYVVQGASRKTCPGCGCAVDPNSRYCPNCGARLL
ncbi:zinc ribbon domain-containing protein [Caproiciproducens sp. CPB-2]|uniref:zinc ribbon domain-containing protein n=1 Tax=Caproiciproducens sp. CPB-2 TaxID=3030017 RepID=UPI0023DCB754|nr:zinc ribbon domain-containing protein [Caproiciproducens sp. CPB-2]MDF1495917.1 zinc ribbon domain-containing protein [Caproiciproducens sp. CPB-2]